MKKRTIATIIILLLIGALGTSGYALSRSSFNNRAQVNTASTNSIFDFYESDIPQKSKTYLFDWLRSEHITSTPDNLIIRKGSFKKTIAAETIPYKHIQYILDIKQPHTSIQIINDIPLDKTTDPALFQPPTILCAANLTPAEESACRKVTPEYE